MPLVFCFIFLKKIKTKSLRLFFCYTISYIVFLILAGILTKIFYPSRYPYGLLLRFYVIIEYCIVSLFIRSLLSTEIFKKIIKYSIVPFILLTITLFLLHPNKTIDSIPAIIEAFLIIVFIIFYFYEKVKTVLYYPLYRIITFWICVAFFFYFTGNFFFFILMDSYSQKDYPKEYLLIYIIVTTIKNIILCVSLFAKEPTQESQELQIPDDLNLDDFLPENTKPES